MLRPFPLTLAILAVTALAAPAQTDKPSPGCAGLAVKDPPGDAPSENQDVTAMWFDTTDGTTVSIQVKNLATPDSGALGPQTRWYANWEVGGTGRFVRAASDGTFAYGDRDATGYSTAGNTRGKFFTGPEGVIQIRIPSGLAPADRRLDSPYVEVKQAIAHPAGAQFAGEPDRAPNEGGGKAYTVIPCGGGPPEEVARGALALKAPRSARAPRTRTLSLKLTSPGTVTDLEGRLYRGRAEKPTVMGRGKLSRLDRRGTLKIRLSRKARRGTYGLYLLGTNPDGTRADLTLKIRLT